MAFQHINNFKTVLSSALASGATTASIPNADAAILEAKAPSVADPIQLTLYNGTDIEIVQCTDADGTTGDVTIIREQENTVSPSSFDAGSTVSARITAAMLDSYLAGSGGGGLTYVNHGNAASSQTISPEQGEVHYYETGPNGSGNDPTFTFDLSSVTSYIEFSLIVLNPDTVNGDHYITWIFNGIFGDAYILTDQSLVDGSWSTADISNPYLLIANRLLRMDFMFDPNWSNQDVQFKMFLRPTFEV